MPRDQTIRGTDMVEYIVLLAAISLFAIAMVDQVGDKVDETFTAVEGRTGDVEQYMTGKSNSVAAVPEGYEPASLVPDDWMRLKERVQPGDPADTFIANEPLQQAASVDAKMLRPNYNLSFDNNMRTAEDGSGTTQIRISRGHNYLQHFPPGETRIYDTVQVGDVFWLQYRQDPKDWWIPFEISSIEDKRRIRSALGPSYQLVYFVDAEYLGDAYTRDPRSLIYEDGEWFREKGYEPPEPSDS